MRPSVSHVLAFSVAFVATGLMGLFALGAQVTLDYDPTAGDSTAYALQVHAEAKDASGQSLVTHATSTVEVKIVDVKRDANVPVDKNNIVETVIEVSQKNGVVTLTSGDKTERRSMKDSTLKVVADAEGAITKVLAGRLDKSFVAELAGVCATIGKTERPKLKQKWTVPVKMALGGETAEGSVTYELTGSQKIDGEDTILISSSGKVAHTFARKGAVKNMTFEWNGKTCYSVANGRFARVVVQAAAAGTLDDGSRAEVTNMSLLMRPIRKEEEGAALPAGGGFLAGSLGGFPILPMIFALGLVGVAACVARMRGYSISGCRQRPVAFLRRSCRRGVLRQGLVCALGVLMAVYGMPIGVAEAAGAESLIAFSQLGTEALCQAGGFTTAGGAGVCMTGTKATSLSTAYAMAPSSGGGELAAAAAALPEGFVQTTGAAVGSPAAAAGGGLLTTTNALIGGGVLAASAGVGVALGSGGGSSGTRCPTTPIDDVTVPNLPGTITFVISTRGTEAADDPLDQVELYVNGALVATVDVKLTATTVANVPLNVGDNDVQITYSAGGHNNCAILEVVLAPTTDPGGTHLWGNVWVGPGQSTSATITRQP